MRRQILSWTINIYMYIVLKEKKDHMQDLTANERKTSIIWAVAEDHIMVRIHDCNHIGVHFRLGSYLNIYYVYGDERAQGWCELWSNFYRFWWRNLFGQRAQRMKTVPEKVTFLEICGLNRHILMSKGIAVQTEKHVYIKLRFSNWSPSHRTYGMKEQALTKKKK